MKRKVADSMETKQLKEMLLMEENKAEKFTGWDFSHLKGRWKDEQIPWDYFSIIKQYLKADKKLLDMGTGGGEFLLSLHHPYSLCAISEGYLPNVLLCKQKLAPLGIQVEQIFDDQHIPYEDDRFDIVINRHEDYDLREVKRILKKDGIFITQQIGKDNDWDLIQRVLPKQDNRNNKKVLSYAIKEAEELDFQILDAKEVMTPLLFYDLGAFVYFAKIISWEFVGLSVEAHFDRLLTMQKEIEANGYLQGSEHHFLLVLKK